MSRTRDPVIFMPPPSGDGSGATDSAALAAAIAQLPNGHGFIHYRSGNYFNNTPIAPGNYIRLTGEGGLGGGAAPATLLEYVGPNAANFLSWNGGVAGGVGDMMVFAASGAFTGRLLDLGSSTLCTVERCYLGAVDTTAAVLAYLDTAVEGSIDKCNIVGGRYGIQGIATGGHVSNGLAITRNRIGGQAAAGGCISGIGGGWFIGGNIFELQPGQAAVRAGPSPAIGGAFVGNWTGDAAAATLVMELFANGLLVGGNYIAGNAGTGIKFMGTSDGVSIKGNRFDSHTLAIDKNAQAVTAEIGPNSYFNVTTHHNFVAAGAPFVEA